MSEIIQPLILPSWDLGNIAYGPEDAAFPELWEGLVGYWDPSLGPTGLTLFDIVNGNNGQIIGATAADAWVVAERGWANVYDGVDDVVTIADSPNFDEINTLSVICWIKWANNPIEDIETIVGKRSATEFQWQFRVREDLGNLLNFLPTTGGSISSNDAIIIGEWTMCGVVFDRGTVTLYINGRATNQAGGMSMTAFDIPLGIGRRAVGNEHQFKGLIGPLSIYEIALPESRIQLMAAGASPMMLAEPMVLKAPDVGLLLKQSNMDGGMENLSGGFV